MRKLKALTKEGKNRKSNRLIVDFLIENHPDIYMELSKRASRVIKRDNASPLAEVMTIGLDTIHTTSDYIKKEQMLAKSRKDKFIKKHNVTL